MSSQRSHDDTWDIATSVGSTAVMVAAARAAETALAEPLIRDPLAGALVGGVGSGVWDQMMDPALAQRLAEFDPEMSAIFTHMRNYQAVRTHFFDAYFAASVAAGVRQVVILASGLDSRAYRLEWPSGTVVFEIDQPKVLEYKATVLAAEGASASAVRHEVPVDLRFDWPAALKAAGFDPAQPTAWLAEGLLMYLPSDAQDRLFDNITALSAPGSRIAAETAPMRAEDRRAEMRSRFEKVAEHLGVEHDLDVTDLFYNDPDRTELIGWLNGSGWQATGTRATDEMRRLGRWTEVTLSGGAGASEDPDAFSTFVLAERH